MALPLAADKARTGRHAMQIQHRDRLARFSLPLIPLVIAVVIVWQIQPQTPTTPGVGPAVELESLHFRSGEHLATHFRESLDYTWPPGNSVPAVAIEAFPDDLSSLRVSLKKSVFFRSLLPMILAENRRIAAARERLRALDSDLDANPDAPLEESDRAFADRLLQRYRVEGDIRDPQVRDSLLRRVDTVPPALALAQAANESGWGTSRFTREANNLFGEWTWNEEIGLLPRRRAEGATHFIRIFPTLHASVRAYMHNLNTGHAYSYLRQMRARLRNQGQSPDGLTLALGLERYSERGQAYVDEIQAMIRANNLDALPSDLSLRDPGMTADKDNGSVAETQSDR